MITKITGEQPFQVLTNNFSISPSSEGYTLQISADGKQYSNLFTVGAGVTRLVTGVAANSYYRLSGNQSKVSINWMKTCVTEGGAAGNELTPVTEFPLNADPGTVVALASGDTYGIYQYDGTNWNEAGADVDLSAYWTSAETQSAITVVEDHLFDVEQVTASALTELHDGLLEVSGRTVDMSAYWTSAETKDYVDGAVSGISLDDYYTSAQTQSAITAALEDLDLSNYATTGDMQSAFTLISETQQVAAAGLNQLEGRIDELSAATPSVDLSAYYTSAQTEDAISAATSGKADAANLSTADVNHGDLYFPKWNEQGIITGKTGLRNFQIRFDVNGIQNRVTSPDSGYIPSIWAPTNAGTAGDILVSTGRGAPVWSAVTMPDMAAYTPTSGFSTINGSAITNGGNIVIEGGADMSAYYTSAQTEEAISAATSGKANAANVTPNVYMSFPKWNEQGVITGTTGNNLNITNAYINGISYKLVKERTSGDVPQFYAPANAGTAGQILVSAGNGAPVWSAVTFPDVSSYVTSAQVETQIVEKNYITSADTANMVTSTSVSTIWRGTQTEYDAIATKNPNTFYIIVNNN